MIQIFTEFLFWTFIIMIYWGSKIARHDSYMCKIVTSMDIILQVRGTSIFSRFG